MADLYEAGKLDSFEWTQRLERAYDPQPVWASTDYYKGKDGRTYRRHKPLHYLDYSRVNRRDGRYPGHPFLEALDEIKQLVRSVHSEYWKAAKEREQEQRSRQFVRDWYGTEEVPGALPDLFGVVERRRVMSRAAAARRYGHSYGKAKKDAEALMEEAPKEGPHRHRWLKERGL